MYCIKVPIGKERSLVRQYSSGFLPTYVPATTDATNSKIPGKVRKLVVPGFIFTLNMVRGAEKVEDWEWQLIEALSSTQPTTVNKRAKVIDGPLVGLDEYIAVVENGRAMIKARLLGEYRSYWINISTPDEKKPGVEEKKNDGEAPDVVELKQTKGEGRKMAEYTQDQIDEILKRAKEVGIHQSARENNVPWQKVQSWAKKAGVEITPKVSKKKKKTTTAPEPATSTPAKTNAGKNEAGKNGAGKNAVEDKKGGEAKPKRGRKKKAVYEVVEAATPAVAEEKVEVEKQAEKPASELEIENAVLRKENEQLKAKIEKLQKALADLI